MMADEGRPVMPDAKGVSATALRPTFRTTPSLLDEFRPSGRISAPEEPTLPPPYRRKSLEHLGLVAGMFDALGVGEVLDRATQQHPEQRLVTVGNAVKAMGLNGLGLGHQQRSLVPRFFQNKPTHRLIAPGIEASQLDDDPLGRMLDTRYADGVTARYSFVATTAAQRLGLTSTWGPLDRTSFHFDGRDNSAAEPDEPGMHVMHGYSRDQSIGSASPSVPPSVPPQPKPSRNGGAQRLRVQLTRHKRGARWYRAGRSLAATTRPVAPLRAMPGGAARATPRRRQRGCPRSTQRSPRHWLPVRP